MGTSPLLDAVLRMDVTLPVGLSGPAWPLSRRVVVVGVTCVGDVSTGSLRFLGVVVVVVGLRGLRGRGWDGPAESFIERVGRESAGVLFVGFVVRGAIFWRGEGIGRA